MKLDEGDCVIFAKLFIGPHFCASLELRIFEIFGHCIPQQCGEICCELFTSIRFVMELILYLKVTNQYIAAIFSCRTADGYLSITFHLPRVE